MNRTTIILAGVVLVLLAATRCTKETGKIPVKSTAIKCDTITYTGHVQAVIDAKCGSGVNCHASGGQAASIPLTDYAKVKARVTDINTDVFVNGTMPQGNKPLTENEKALLRCWLDNGNLE